MLDGFVYIAGPYRGKDALAHDASVYCEIDTHINNARRWAIKFATDGIPFFCPHLNSAHMEVMAPDADPDYWLNMDLKILRYATALFLLPDWPESRGAQAEWKFAVEEEIPVYTDYERLKEELKNAIHSPVPA